MRRHTMTEIVNHSGNTSLEQSVKTLLGGEGVGWGRGANIDFT